MESIHIADDIEKVNYWIGLCLNLILMYIILVVSHAEIGAYKYLQLTFIMNDVVYATYSYVMKEKVMTNDHTFVLFLSSPYGNNRLLACLYCGLFSLILVIVAYNFLYRYLAVFNPNRIQLFYTLWFTLVLLFAAIAEFFIWYATCYFLFDYNDAARADLADMMYQKYGIDAHTQEMVMGDYWRDGHYNTLPIAGLAIFCFIIIAGLSFMVYCSIAIVRHLAQAKVMSVKTRNMQYTLFRMLVAQKYFFFFSTVVPLIFVHSDAGQALILPLFGINIDVLSDWSSTAISFFPSLDAIVVIMLMRDYREAIKSAVLCRSCWKKIADHNASTTAVILVH